MNKRKQKADEDQAGPCHAEKQAEFDPSHRHTCIGGHSGSPDHFCGECKRWWGEAA